MAEGTELLDAGISEGIKVAVEIDSGGRHLGGVVHWYRGAPRARGNLRNC